MAKVEIDDGLYNFVKEFKPFLVGVFEYGIAPIIGVTMLWGASFSIGFILMSGILLFFYNVWGCIDIEKTLLVGTAIIGGAILAYFSGLYTHRQMKEEESKFRMKEEETKKKK